MPWYPLLNKSLQIVNRRYESQNTQIHVVAPAMAAGRSISVIHISQIHSWYGSHLIKWKIIANAKNKKNRDVYDDIIKWEHIQRNWPFVKGNHRSPVDSPHKGQWCGALMFSLICAWTNGWANNRDAGDLRCHRAHYDVPVMKCS